MRTKNSILLEFVILYIGSYNAMYIDRDYDCLNPNNVSAVCISLYTCPTLLDIFINSPENVEDQRFLQQSYCENGFGIPPHVCCSNEISFAEIELQPSTPKTNNQLASSDECTWKQEDMDMNESYMYGVLEGDSKTWIYNCIGSLINNRYVLTTGCCGNLYRLTKFGFGKYSTNDCDDNSTCPKYDLSYGIEKIIVHENYTLNNDDYWENDIALVRLSQDVPYTEKIRPLCLPSVVGFEGSKMGDEIMLPYRKLAYPDDLNFISIVKVIDMEKCNEELRYSNHHICIDSGFGQYAWYNIGSPLVRNYQNTKIIDAIFSNGFISHPKVRTYTAISKYEEWIKSKLER